MQVRSLSIRCYWGKMKKKEVIQFPPQHALIGSAQLKKKMIKSSIENEKELSNLDWTNFASYESYNIKVPVWRTYFLAYNRS